MIVKKKKTKSIEQSQIITYEPESFENPNFIDIKPIIAENPNTSEKLSILEKINFNSNSSKYNDTRELEIFWTEKKLKITKQAHDFKFKGYARSHIVKFF